MAIQEIDYERVNRDISSQVTVLTHTPSATEPMMCMGLVVLGDGVDDLDGTGGLFELTITVGGNTVQPDPQGTWFSTADKSSVWTSAFPVPAGMEVVLKVKSPNAADVDVDIRAYLYSARLGHFCPTDCTNCCYLLRVWIYYLAGKCPGSFDCTNYNGNWILIQDGAAGLDCSWTYTDPADGFTIKVHCELGYWWLTIEHDGNTCGQWRYSQENFAADDCPPVALQNWEWVQGDCTGNAWAFIDCIQHGDRPAYPPAWYHDDLLGVLRYRRI